MQYLWLPLKKEKESQEKNNQKESQEEKEITCPLVPASRSLSSTPIGERVSSPFKRGPTPQQGIYRLCLLRDNENPNPCALMLLCSYAL